MAIPERWAIRDAGIATFESLATGETELTLRTLKATGLDMSTDTVYARGGYGNPKLVGFTSNNEIKVTLQDAIFTNETLAMLLGSETETGDEVKINEILVLESGTVTLKATPVGTVEVFSIDKGGSFIEKLEATVSGKVVTVTGGTNGGKVEVHYRAASGASSKKIRKIADKFAGHHKMYLDCLVRDLVTKQDYHAQIEFPCVKIEDNFSLDLSADGDPSVSDINLEVLKSLDHTDMFFMTIYDEAELE